MNKKERDAADEIVLQTAAEGAARLAEVAKDAAIESAEAAKLFVKITKITNGCDDSKLNELLADVREATRKVKEAKFALREIDRNTASEAARLAAKVAEMAGDTWEGEIADVLNVKGRLKE